MTQSNEQAKQEVPVERTDCLLIDGLHIGDRLRIVAQDGRSNHPPFDMRSFILDVVGKKWIIEDGKGRFEIVFTYGACFNEFAFCNEQGEPIILKPTATLESGFSSPTKRASEEYQSSYKDYSHIKTTESYWFRNADGTGKTAVALYINQIVIARRAYW